MTLRFPHWLAALVLLYLAQPAFADGAQFSADMVQKAAGQTQTMRIYQGGKKMRMEMTSGGNQQTISIVDLAARKMFMLMPANKVYMEMPLDTNTAAWAVDEKSRGDYFEMKHVGTETVNGYVCDKYVLTPKKPGLEKSTAWIAKKLGYLIKSVGENYSMELTNIKEGPQAASLFTVPKGYQKMPGMGGLPGAMAPR